MTSPQFNMEVKYEIRIGETTQICEKQDFTIKTVPKQVLLISEEQLAIIEQFAHVERDEELNKIYTLNNCKFKILPHLNNA